MSVSAASFKLSTSYGAYAYTISSCNPGQPVAFQGNEPYDPTRLTESGFIGGKYPASLSIATFPQVLVPSTWDQNPIKLVIFTLLSGGAPGASIAVLYGYYTQPYAGGLGFYLNRNQSSIDPYTGSNPAVFYIDNTVPSIVLR